MPFSLPHFRPDRRSLTYLRNGALNIGSKNKNRFPWRQHINPYHVFISEFLLQRTQANQAAGVFSDFINKYPDLLAAQRAHMRDLDRLLRPLGLKHRVNALKKALRQLKARHIVAVPDQEDDLQKLFGVGRYMARAVLCFGYKEQVGLIDPNISRIFERYFRLSDIPPRPHASRDLWALADLVIRYNGKDPRMLNWGLIDIGREICKKRKPDCRICPLLKRCTRGMEFINDQTL